MASPLIRTIAGEASGRLTGKEVVRAYWGKGLQLLPDLQFELQAIFVGIDSITLTYNGHRGMAAEVFEFGPAGIIQKASAHYSQ